MRNPSKPFTLIIVLMLMTTSFNPSPTAPTTTWQSKVDPWVLTASSGETEFILFLSEQADLSRAAALKTKLEKGVYVFERLTQVAERTQKPVIATLDAWGATYRPYWVANMVWVRGNIKLVESLAKRADVAHIYANPSALLDTPSNASPGNSPQTPDTIEWNILKVNADDVWAAGYTGQGAVIGGQDTGYTWDHPALKDQYRGWDSLSADHNYNWHDAIHADDPNTSPGNPCGFDSTEPCDDDLHGTHTMGIMVGDDGGGNQIGMAPGARWIGCRNMEERWGTPATYSECYQWFIAPTDLNDENPRPDLAPDVINNSWSCPVEEGCTDPNVLLTVVNNVRAAGILTAHSAGNYGPYCSTVNSPAAIYDASFTVGNTTSDDTINPGSSRGPVSVDGSGRMKPDVSAPGTFIRSSVLGDNYTSLTGTSMAAPHVAGLVALLISANPSLAGEVDLLETLIEQSAVPLTTTQTCGGVPGTQIPNNTYGWGRIDSATALDNVHRLVVDKSVSATQIAPADILTYTITVTHNHIISPTINVVLTDSLPVSTIFITATLPHSLDTNTIRWDFSSLDAGESRSVELVIQVPLTATGTIENVHYAVASDQVSVPITGSVISTTVIIAQPFFDIYLPLVLRDYHLGESGNSFQRLQNQKRVLSGDRVIWVRR